jgi:hypothetical protein
MQTQGKERGHGGQVPGSRGKPLEALGNLMLPLSTALCTAGALAPTSRPRLVARTRTQHTPTQALAVKPQLVVNATTPLITGMTLCLPLAYYREHLQKKERESKGLDEPLLEVQAAAFGLEIGKIEGRWQPDGRSPGMGPPIGGGGTCTALAAARPLPRGRSGRCGGASASAQL